MCRRWSLRASWRGFAQTNYNVSVCILGCTETIFRICHPSRHSVICTNKNDIQEQSSLTILQGINR